MSLEAPLRALLLAAGPAYLPEQASSVAVGVDQVFAFLFWLSAFFLAGVHYWWPKMTGRMYSERLGAASA